MKRPPHGKAIAERLKFRNNPDHLIVCIGLDSWQRAKEWNDAPNDTPAMVAPSDKDPRTYAWPVHGQLVVIEAACGPSDNDLRNLAAVLLAYGAEAVTVISCDGLNSFKQYIAEGREVAA